MSYCFDPDEMETLRSVVKEIQRSLGGGIMKIKDMQTLPEFFGVELGSPLWVEGKRFKVYRDTLGGEQSTPNEASRALVGCLTGQLEWSTEEPTKDEEDDNED